MTAIWDCSLDCHSFTMRAMYRVIRQQQRSDMGHRKVSIHMRLSMVNGEHSCATGEKILVGCYN